MGNIKPDFLSIARQYDIRTVYDCGSRDALEGMELARQLKAAELHVFECNPDGIRLCRQNLVGFTDAKVFLNELAVCEREGEIDQAVVNEVAPERAAGRAGCGIFRDAEAGREHAAVDGRVVAGALGGEDEHLLGDAETAAQPSERGAIDDGSIDRVPGGERDEQKGHAARDGLHR
jgi:hypothetical protein